MFSAILAAWLLGCTPPAPTRAEACTATAAAGTVYVDAAAGSDDDAGDPDSPVATISKALTLSRAVALAPGRYRETLSLTEPAAISTRCGGDVVIDGDGAPGEATMFVRLGGDVVLDGVTITGGDRFGLSVERGTVTLRDVDVVANRGAGLRISGSTAVVFAEDSRFSENAPGDEALAWGQGVYSDHYGSFDGRGVTIADNVGLGVFMVTGALTLADSRVTGTRSNEDGSFGDGIHVEHGAEVTIRESEIADNRNVGVYASLPNTHVELTDSLISGTLPSDSGLNGHGIAVWTGGALDATNVTVETSQGAGVFVENAGSLVTLTDSVIRDTQGDADGLNGFAVAAWDGGQVMLRDTRLERNFSGVLVTGVGASATLYHVDLVWPNPPEGVRGSGLTAEAGGALTVMNSVVSDQAEVGLLAIGEGTVATLTDSSVLDTHALLGKVDGNGVVVQDGASVSLTRAVIRGNHTAGVHASGFDTTVSIADTEITEGLALPDGRYGRGLDIENGAAVSVVRTRIQFNQDCGIFLHFATLDIFDSVISDTDLDGELRSGRGLSVDSDSTMHMARCEVARNHEGGIIALGASTLVTLEDVSVTGTMSSPRYSGGLGVVADSRAEVVADGLTVSDSEGPGLLALDLGSVECRRCTISGNGRAGVVVRNAAFSLTDSLVVDNGDADEGVGILVDDQAGAGPFVVSDSVVDGHADAGVWIVGPGEYSIARTTLSGGAGVAIREGLLAHGNALYVDGGDWGASTLDIVDNTFSGNTGASVFLDGASASLAGNVYSDSGWGVLQQGCGSIAVPKGIESAPTREICPAVDAMVLTFPFSIYLDDTEAIEE